MKRILYGLLVLTVFASSCSSDPEWCIDGPISVEPGSTHTYTYCGDSDVDKVEWEFKGQTYEGLSVDITFDELVGVTHLEMEVTSGGDKTNNDDGISQYLITKAYGDSPDFYIQAYLQTGLSSSGEIIPNVNVKIYSQPTCWLNDTETDECLVFEGKSDENGLVKITGLDKNNINYIIEIESDNWMNNWVEYGNMNLGSWYQELREGSGSKVRPKEIIVKSSPYSYLVSASKWQISDVKADGTSQWSSISDCTKDNYLTFDKNLEWELHEGIDICSSSAASTGGYNLPTEQTYYDQISDFRFSMFTNTGSAIFDNPFFRISQNKIIFTTYSSPQIEMIYTRVQ